MPLLVQTNTVNTGATGSEQERRPSATPIMARDWSAAYTTDANTAAEWSAYLEGKADAAKWRKGLGASDDKLYFSGHLLIPSSLELEYIVELHDLQHASTAKMHTKRWPRCAGIAKYAKPPPTGTGYPRAN